MSLQMPSEGGGYSGEPQDFSQRTEGPPTEGEWIVIPRSVIARNRDGEPFPLPRYANREGCEWIPASVAIENCAFPLEYDERRSTILLADDADEQTMERLEFILNRRLTIAFALREYVARLIEVAYGRRSGERESNSCGRRFRSQCTLQWSGLLPTSDENVRFCNDCSRPVYYCRDDEELRLRSSAGQCAAFDLYSIDRGSESIVGDLLMGDVELTPPPPSDG